MHGNINDLIIDEIVGGGGLLGSIAQGRLPMDVQNEFSIHVIRYTDNSYHEIQHRTAADYAYSAISMVLYRLILLDYSI